MKALMLIGLLLVSSVVQAQEDDNTWSQIPVGKKRFFACFPDNGGEVVMQQDGDLCSPKKVKEGLKRSLRLSYADAFKRYGWGTEVEALKTAREMYKAYKCQWVNVTIEPSF